ncbi:hypothetical protein PIB30_045371 [Stylosanthes scabra]|uniref:Uncharacterized protein n=1 Tax=Stylosanthes scabra TaxID=79078 RepID=A0ABU6TI99_9FABA|nr:hypothetical protein [Stylosanthes scabra]
MRQGVVIVVSGGRRVESRRGLEEERWGSEKKWGLCIRVAFGVWLLGFQEFGTLGVRGPSPFFEAGGKIEPFSTTFSRRNSRKSEIDNHVGGRRAGSFDMLCNFQGAVAVSPAGVAEAPHVGNEFIELTKDEAEADSVMIVERIGSFNAIDFERLTCAEIKKLEFVSLQAAYYFYNGYGLIKGFSIRRSKEGHSSKVGF